MSKYFSLSMLALLGVLILSMRPAYASDYLWFAGTAQTKIKLALHHDGTEKWLHLESTSTTCGPKGHGYQRIGQLTGPNSRFYWSITNTCGESALICIQSMSNADFGCATYKVLGWSTSPERP